MGGVAGVAGVVGVGSDKFACFGLGDRFITRSDRSLAGLTLNQYKYLSRETSKSPFFRGTVV
ncbi:hypothetical protein [Dapis sp. BLCC M229]|uniref:hypothetical protein n=1 Tax=Dapis sp. BLCC M229 TaxID=3400188 RepID=UPI003CF4C848